MIRVRNGGQFGVLKLFESGLAIAKICIYDKQKKQLNQMITLLNKKSRAY